KAAKQALFRLKRYVYEEYGNKGTTPHPDYLQRFHEYINHDLDTPQALALLFEITKDDRLTPGEKCATMQAMDVVLDIGLRDKRDAGLASIGVVSVADIPKSVQDLMKARDIARLEKDWTESDRLRTLINEAGYAVEDTPQGTKVSNL
ncbi:MAG: hypothetical protein KBD44_01140, partial [Candidatus Pacebacteria bacterium]|nr:hypothetical protein [Candidatus Paceibacterota bacterium]